MDYQVTSASGKSYIHMWNVESTEVFEGGFLIDKTTLPTGCVLLPKGSFLKVDLTERKAAVIKTAVLYEALTALATTVKIKKGSLLIATDYVGIGSNKTVVGTIDTSNADYDSFSIVANALGVVALNGVLQSYTSAGVAINPDGFSFCDVAIDAQPSVTVIYEADGIVAERMPSMPTDAIITALKHCQILKK